MKIYHYHREHGALLGCSDADPSPLEPGVFLVPAFATDQAPPDYSDQHIPVFVDNEWQVVPDYRGKTRYNTKDPGQSVLITMPGALPKGWTLLQPEHYTKWNEEAGKWEYSKALEAPDKAAAVRAERDETVVRVSHEIERKMDAGEDAGLWRKYRQKLRDLPEQKGFPFDVSWPERPGVYTGK